MCKFASVVSNAENFVDNGKQGKQFLNQARLVTGFCFGASFFMENLKCFKSGHSWYW